MLVKEVVRMVVEVVKDDGGGRSIVLLMEVLVDNNSGDFTPIYK